MELVSLDFLLSSLSTKTCLSSCPNCGFRLISDQSTIFQKKNLSKAIILICCGSFVCWKLIKDRNEISYIFLSIKQLIQNGMNILLSWPSTSPISSSSTSNLILVDQQNRFNQSIRDDQSNINNHLYIVNTNQINLSDSIVTNENRNFGLLVDHTDQSINDYSSLHLSPLNSIGNTTLNRLEQMLDEVAEIKLYMNDSFNELQYFNIADHTRAIDYRRLSEGELTSLSLEWDINDINFDDDNNDDKDESITADNNDEDRRLEERFSNERLVRNDNPINLNLLEEQLSTIIFNKDFEFKEEKFFRMKKQSIFLKQRLRSMISDNHQSASRLHNASPNDRSSNNFNYRTNRDSAFFEEIP
ncbi:hypothetical protein SSS_08542 [Sarcoptes scabiei]|uniref:Uncharacterized protein n=1 Tax=Sarcoptes scabiei TaxID=52283 RepID=A0A834VFJ4_SARSC|nr:hypothetical protein SSS_08542 [Sarcoptes scabiei]